ncbi:MAG: hypothetical protein RL637_164 [Pseudomonadota bacterium]|jgi:hypothetical protein
MFFNHYIRNFLILLGLASLSVSYAATFPEDIAVLDAVNNTTTFTVTKSGWSDPEFGNAGWTHNSGWGSFYAKQGQMVSLIIQAKEDGIHPGASLWFRGDKDTAPNKYVVDHFYTQNGDIIKFGATDESTGQPIGNIVMEHIRHGYDLDNNTVDKTNPIVRKLNGKLDKIPGRLVLNIKMPYTGDYMFVVGGFNPNIGIQSDKLYSIEVKLKIKN